MASMASTSFLYYNKYKNKRQPQIHRFYMLPVPRIVLSQSSQFQQPDDKPHHQIPRREIILKCGEIAVIGAFFNFSWKKPEYLGVQKNPPSLALCPATNNCISTSENVSDPNHYAPPWKKAVNREAAMEELLQVIKSTKADKYIPKIVEKQDNYVRVEYQSPILGLVDDVEFWFPPGKNSLVEYRSASRIWNFDFDINRKRIKALRVELEKRGWGSAETF